jgi:hypothetical protein
MVTIDQGNVISGNIGDGVTISGSAATKITVVGNDIGTDAAGKLKLGNGGDGVDINGASNNQIGGPGLGTGNVIEFNSGEGVLVSAGTGDSIRCNTIFANTAGGIRLSNGGNNNLNFPMMVSAQSMGAKTIVKGMCFGPPNTTVTLDFFANLTPDQSGYGQGQELIGSQTVALGLSGPAVFKFTLSMAVTPGWYVAATTTDQSGDTSQFSNVVLVHT